MLDVIRRGRRWLTALFVVGIGGVFAVFIGVGSPLQPGGDSIITVGQHQIGIQEFLRTRQSTEQRYQDAFGDSFDADKFSDMINSNTAMELQQRAILALEAEEIGLTVAKEEVEREILTYAGLRDESGNFSREAYENWIYREFGSERLFREQQRRGVLSGKLARLLFRQAYVSEQEARDAVVGSLEEVKLAFPVLDGRGEEVERAQRDIVHIADRRGDDIEPRARFPQARIRCRFTSHGRLN